jgi:hypothetical protein
MKLIVALLRQALIVIFFFGSSVSADETVYIFILINGYVHQCNAKGLRHLQKVPQRIANRSLRKNHELALLYILLYDIITQKIVHVQSSSMTLKRIN